MTTTKMLGYLNFSRAIENYIWIAWMAIVGKLTRRLILTLPLVLVVYWPCHWCWWRTDLAIGVAGVDVSQLLLHAGVDVSQLLLQHVQLPLLRLQEVVRHLGEDVENIMAQVTMKWKNQAKAFVHILKWNVFLTKCLANVKPCKSLKLYICTNIAKSPMAIAHRYKVTRGGLCHL